MGLEGTQVQPTHLHCSPKVGSLSHGKDVATAEIMGADMAYMETWFLATVEANITHDYQNMITSSSASDILYIPKISDMNASFIRQSEAEAGIDPTDLPPKSEVDFDDELELRNQKSNEKKHGEILGLQVKAWVLLIEYLKQQV